MESLGKILAVMSDLFFSVKIIDVAKKLGLAVEVVSDRNVAIAKAKALPPLIIIDLNCAGADPLGLIRAIKADPSTARIPIFAFVSHVQTQLRQQALDAGCDTVVARAVFSGKLPELLATAAQSRAAG